MRVTFPEIDSAVPTSVLRSRYRRHAVRSSTAWLGEAEQMAIGSTFEAHKLALAAIESRDYAELLRQELRRRNVRV